MHMNLAHVKAVWFSSVDSLHRHCYRVVNMCIHTSTSKVLGHDRFCLIALYWLWWDIFLHSVEISFQSASADVAEKCREAAVSWPNMSWLINRYIGSVNYSF